MPREIECPDIRRHDMRTQDERMDTVCQDGLHCQHFDNCSECDAEPEPKIICKICNDTCKITVYTQEEVDKLVEAAVKKERKEVNKLLVKAMTCFNEDGDGWNRGMDTLVKIRVRGRK